MTTRKIALATGETYHVFNRSVEGKVIFLTPEHFGRFLALLEYQRIAGTLVEFSRFYKKAVHGGDLRDSLKSLRGQNGTLVDILAYCLMPNHFHLVLRQTEENGISIFLQKLQNSYARYFNLKSGRSGHLWAGPFQSVYVESDEQFQHLTRYIHLNPVTAKLVERPEDWKHSSYTEYTHPLSDTHPRVCRFTEQLGIPPEEYAKFVTEYIDPQRELHLLKKSLSYQN